MTHPKTNIGHIQMVGFHESTPNEMIDYYERNKSHLKNSMPLRSAEFYKNQYWQQQIDQYINDVKHKKALRFVLKDQHHVIGTISFDQMIYGAFCSCYLGYALDQNYQGRGIMTQSLQFGLDYIFTTLHLNRVMANYIPNNRRSAKILEKLGFEKEGYAKRYLMINGIWQDHILTSRVRDLE
ncbi:GNAT family N-acetyltransferase [Acinetobacter rathckeae]|uniref:GNAT family N-acetyltransferase n=1 Tax=Acinetobacter rathckeae TaxID=2605272 RepID=UPI0018A32C37|nr:GNAT family N-acetyltransferase [Acinetobacter rathckeae]MBF7688885.1 GNAT family N-acetyltransferase [Acinetobacter rathckeae]MBF7696398.1 GNAT family N-acetyltransferase [Acinetobacter rathckeae]